MPGTIGSTGAVRSSAWICGFSSTEKTAAFRGGSRYRPTTSRTFSIRNGSVDTLKSSTSQGLRPKARQTRCTLLGEIPTRFASSRLDQWVAPSGTSSRVRTTTSSTWASLIVRGAPGLGSSLSPAHRCRTNRFRHLPTVSRLIPSSAATDVLVLSSAHINTMRARWARPCAVLRRLAHP
ncbi:hypothetical protein FMEAI12_7420002 [Parafrankia sp. Ea1.12]|nr:hypothetical protein FMEAI12_7420002 [Parafrankia sp. Ea1.12]